MACSGQPETGRKALRCSNPSIGRYQIGAGEIATSSRIVMVLDVVTGHDKLGLCHLGVVELVRRNGPIWEATLAVNECKASDVGISECSSLQEAED